MEKKKEEKNEKNPVVHIFFVQIFVNFAKL